MKLDFLIDTEVIWPLRFRDSCKAKPRFSCATSLKTVINFLIFSTLIVHGFHVDTFAPILQGISNIFHCNYHYLILNTIDVSFQYQIQYLLSLRNFFFIDWNTILCICIISYKFYIYIAFLYKQTPVFCTLHQVNY